MPSIAAAVKAQQCAWARSGGHEPDSDGYCASVSENLFQPLTPCTEAEFRAADGDELGRPGQRAKMQALHSSSALAVNFFDYWRGRDTMPLAEALGVPGPICSIRFEQKRPTGLRGKAPNLDVALQPASGPEIFIESKFLEPYGASAAPKFKEKYFIGRTGTGQALGGPGASGDTGPCRGYQFRGSAVREPRRATVAQAHTRPRKGRRRMGALVPLVRDSQSRGESAPW